MSRKVERLWVAMDKLAARPRAAAALVGLVTAFCLPLLPNLRVDNSLEAWLPHGGAAYREYTSFREQFGSEEYVLVVYPLDIPLGDEFLEQLVDLRLELSEIRGVRGVYDLSTVYSRLFALAGRESFEADLSSPFYRGFLVSEDLRLAATWVLLDRAAVADRAAVVAEIEAAARRSGLDESFRLAGSPVLNVELDKASTAAARWFYPLVLLASAAILLLVFRRLAGVVIPILSVGCGVVWTLAFMVLLGRRLDMVTVALPPVIWVVGLATSIHLLARSQSLLRRGEDAAVAIPDTLAELAYPCLMSAVTTAIGFASLAVSSMPPVREMGLFAAAGVLFCLTTNVLLFPLMGRWWGRGASRWEETSQVSARLASLGQWVTLHAHRVLVGAAVLALLGLVGLTRLRASSNVIEFFDEDTEIARTYEELLPRLTGPYSMEVIVEAGTSWRELRTLQAVDRLARQIEAEPGVARVISVTDFIKKAAAPVGESPLTEDGSEPEAALYEFPTTAAALEEAWELIDQHLAEEVHPLVGRGGLLRLSVIARPMGSAEHRQLVERIESLIERPLLGVRKMHLTGVVTLLVALQEELIVSQVLSFALAFLIIVPVIGLFFRSLRYAAVSLPPNLLPILATLGFMGFTGIALNPATVMIAAVAFGIVVDDTIHFLSHYQESVESGLSGREAALETLEAVGRPLWITSLVVAAGFSVLCFSSFVPLFNFGLLSAATVLMALVGNLILLPALLVVSASLKSRASEASR